MNDDLFESLERDLRLAGLAERLRQAVAASAEPEAAPARVADALRRLSVLAPDEMARCWSTAADGLARALGELAGAAPFLLPILARRPEVVTALAGDDLRQARTRADFDAALAGIGGDGAADALRRVKYAELARITLRELSFELVPLARSGETLRELSDLADALLARALDIAASRLVTTVGLPRWTAPDGAEHTLPFVIFGLGKLGSHELNYSSDVDLVYAYGAVDEVDESELRFVGEADLAPADYFTRMAHEFHRLVSATTAEGFLYRIDLDLRPEGSRGTLVMPAEALLTYFEGTAHPWERAAYMKARPVAGHLEFGWRVLRDLVPVLYRSSMDFEGVAAIKNLKQQVETAKGRSGPSFNIKLGPGGIRDVESVAQAMQLLHGCRMPQIRQRSTQATLEGLEAVGVLSREHAGGLLEAYRFYRRAENRVQMYAERQTHVLPAGGDERLRLARSLGFRGSNAVAEFERALAAHRAFCQERFADVFVEAGHERVLGLFLRHVPALIANPMTRSAFERLAEHFGRVIDQGPNPERALVNLDRFLEGLRGRRFYFELLLDRPELVQRLAALFAASEYLSSFFAAYPRLIEPIFDDPRTLLLSRVQLEEEFQAILREGSGMGDRDPTEVFLEALRLFHHRAMVNIGLVDLDAQASRAEVEAAHTSVAEACIEHGLEIARRQLADRCAEPERATFLVVGMGKLGSRELTYGSDLDVIFLYDVAGADEYGLASAQEYFARLAQKLIWALTTKLVTGACYEVDARLRPSGGQGTLVTSLVGFEAYHARETQVWERQALLRARAVVGDAVLAQQFEQARRAVLARRFDMDPAPEIDRIRRRMQGELARETAQRHDFKIGYGGLLDVESVVQLLQLRHGADHPALFGAEPVAAQIDRLHELALLPDEHFAILAAGWDFLQRLSHRLRIVANRSISDLDEERGDLDALAHTMGYRTLQRSGGARRSLLADYHRHTNAIREVYDAYFSVGG